VQSREYSLIIMIFHGGLHFAAAIMAVHALVLYNDVRNL